MSRSLKSRESLLFASQGLAMVLMVGGAVRCSSGSSNVVQPGSDGAANGSGASTSGTGGSGTSGSGTSGSGTVSGMSSSGTGSSGASGTGAGSSGTSDEGGVVGDTGVFVEPDGGCASTATSAVHVMVAVTWATTSLLTGGSGTVDLWFKSANTLSGTALTATTKACGVTLPDVTTTSIAGSEKIQLKFPDAMWDNSHMPTYHSAGTQTGVGSGGMQTYTAAVTLLGLNPSGTPSKYYTSSTTWPAPPPSNSGTYPQFMSNELSDDDGDGNPAITLTPTGTTPYSLPPTTLDYAHHQADKLYIVSRTTVALSGTLNSCWGASGMATVSQFENHVVGCHDATGTSAAGKPLSGTDCMTSTTGFTAGPGLLDANRTVFTLGSATFKSVQVADDATCAVVRGAI